MTNNEHADRFVAKYNGKYIDEDKSFGSQCWDVVARYAREEFGCTPLPTVSGGAEGLYRFFAQPIPHFFDKVPRYDLAPGDICVWGSSFYPPYGHTSLVWRREGNTIWSFEQDGSNDPNHDNIADGVAYLAQRPITTYISGGLRPKGGTTMANLSRHFAGRLVLGMWGRPITTAELDKYTKVEETKQMKAIIDDPQTDKWFMELEQLKKDAKPLPKVPPGKYIQT